MDKLVTMGEEKVAAAVFILILTGLMFICQAKADIANLYIPEFTVQIVDHFNEDKKANVEVTIKNQPFTPYKENGKFIALYYNIRHKLHTEDWQPADFTSHFPSSKDEFTVKSYDLGAPDWNFSSCSVIDVQVEAIAGYYTILPLPTPFWNTFVGDASGWSSTQTVTIPNSNQSIKTALPTNSPAVSLTPEPTLTPKQQPSGFLGTNMPIEFGYAIVALGIIIVVAGVRSRRFQENKEKGTLEFNSNKISDAANQLCQGNLIYESDSLSSRPIVNVYALKFSSPTST